MMYTQAELDATKQESERRLAEAFGVSHETLRRWLDSRNKPHPAVIAALETPRYEFEVDVTRRMLQYTTEIVEAENAEEAGRIALDQAHDSGEWDNDHAEDYRVERTARTRE